MNEEEQTEESYRKPYEPYDIPINSEQQLGKEILKTFARVSDPDTIVYKRIKRKVPVFSKKVLRDEEGNTIKEVEFVSSYKIEEWDIPIKVQPKYHELITDDISRAFLSADDLAIFRDTASYCKTVKSFCDRYEIDLSIHHNNFADENCLLTTSSGAFKGERVRLAKTNVAETTARQSVYQMMKDEDHKKKSGLFAGLMP